MESGKSKVLAGVLAILLGQFGIHNFYLGNTQRAVIQLSVSLGSYILGTLLAVVCIGFLFYLVPVGISIWAIVEGVQILTGKISTDANGEPLI